MNLYVLIIEVPFGKLPLLEIDGEVFHQSTAILRYLAIEAGLSGNNALENFQIDMIVAAFGDFVAGKVDITNYNFRYTLSYIL